MLFNCNHRQVHQWLELDMNVINELHTKRLIERGHISRGSQQHSSFISGTM